MPRSIFLLERRQLSFHEVRVDGKLITCEPASVLPLAQRYFLL